MEDFSTENYNSYLFEAQALPHLKNTFPSALVMPMQVMPLTLTLNSEKLLLLSDSIPDLETRKISSIIFSQMFYTDYYIHFIII